MKFECSYTDLKGLKVSMAVSAPSSFFEPLSEVEEETCADPSLVSSAFEQAIPELSTQLLQVHHQSLLALLGSYTKLLGRQVGGQEVEA